MTSTTKLSTRGQIVIPQEIRKKWKLKPGQHFVITLAGEAIFIRKVK